jgi:hypothetical protein
VRPGYRLPHAWLEDGVSVYDALGDHLTLRVLGGNAAAVGAFDTAARQRAVPLAVADLRRRDLCDRYGCDLVLVRADQHVAWAGGRAPSDAGWVVDLVRGA